LNSKDNIEKNKKNKKEDVEKEEILDDEEYELVEDDDLEELPDDEEYELVEDDDDEELVEEIEDADEEEYELVDDDDEELAEEVVEDADEEEYELVDDDDEELAEEVEDADEEEYEFVDDDDEELAEEVEDADEEEYEFVDDDDEELAEEIEDADEEYEFVDDDEEELAEEIEDADEEEYEFVDDDEEGLAEEIEDADEENDDIETNDNIDVEETEETAESEELAEDEESEDEEELEEDEYYEDEEEVEENSNEVESDEEDEENEEESIYPDELINLELECVYIGLLFNNPRAISRFYFLYEDCQFSDNELTNLYKIVLFRDGEQFAPAAAKNKYQLPRETPNTYDLKLKVRKIAAAKDYNLEHVYTELKKLFILKKNYIVAATSAIQEKILEIQKYELYDEMTVEEVESALEQITVTTGLTQGRLNENATDFLLAGDNELSAGLSIPFNILTTVFKGLRRGETMCYAMPSNSGKSRFTLNLATYISFIHKEKVLIISNEMAEDKMKLCMITTILNNPEIQKLHGQEISVSETELLELKFRPDKGKKVKCDENGYILRKEGESQEEYVEKLRKNSSVFRQTLKVTDWVNTQMNNSIFFIHITEHTNDDLRKIIMNYYYKEGIHYMFYDTLKADTANIGNSDEVKKTATILSNLAQKFRIFIASSMQLIESNTLPVNLTVNEMSASKTVKEVLDTLCLIKQISRATLNKYEYSDTDQFEVCHDIDVPKDTDVRFYACVVDKNRAGAKPTILFRLNLAYNRWEELGHVRLKQTEFTGEIIDRA
jgi:replicative DNA helicase